MALKNQKTTPHATPPATPTSRGLATEQSEVAEPASKAARLEAAAPWPRWVDPGDEDAAMVETYQTMKMLVPWLRQDLPEHLRRLGHTSVKTVETVPPLAAKNAGDSSALSSYKEMWTPAHCKVAIKATGMYEAGGSLMWLDPGFVGELVSMLHAEPPWSVVVSYQKQFFSREACAGRHGSSEQASSGVGVSTQAGLGRLLFPCPLEAYSDVEARDWSVMPSSMRLLGGQTMVFAWYVAAARAMLASDDALLQQLWQAALTCTIRVQVSTSVSKLVLSAVEVSERYVRFADMADSFIQWATKVQRIIDDTDGGKKLSSQVLAIQLR